jgi:hypothetical protein
VTASALDVFAPELARLDALIHREALRLRGRYELSLDELRGLYITDEQVDALLRHRGAPADFAAVPDIAAARAADRSSRWHRLAQALELSDDERDMLLVCLAPELDSKYETLYAYLNNDVSRRWPTAELATRLIGGSAGDRLRLRAHFLPGARLIATSAIEMVQPDREPVSRLQRALRVAAPVVDWLLGLAYADERLTSIARFGALEVMIPADGLPAGVAAPIARAAQMFGSALTMPPVVVTAPAAADAAMIAQDLFAHAHRHAIVVDLAGLRQISPADIVGAMHLMQRVLGIGLVVSPLDALLDGDGRAVEMLQALVRRLILQSPAVVLAGTDGVPWRDLLPDAHALEIRVPDLTACERAAVWKRALAAGHAGETGADGVPFALADRFLLGPDRVFRAARDAYGSAALAGDARPSRRQLFASARAVSFDGAGAMTRRVVTPFSWDDLVLPAEIRQRLVEIVRAVELRARVLDEWGLARRIGGARGIKILFAGPSGTGKTMAAGIIAKTLQLEMQRIEVGAVASKYIGETEKNLDRAFAAARRGNAVLFIDEADALLGKRSEVKDAHDRYANVEIAYLLQKMEDHDGVVILASNLAQNIDEAFSRRMQFVVEFPQPDEPARERLWRQMFPPDAPLAGDVDFAFLARQFELAGGDIRNVVLDAAYSAAREGAPISLHHVLRAVAMQYAKQGRVLTPADLREHYGALVAAASAPALDDILTGVAGE